MQTKNITITSKNQITLPIEYVRNMHLTHKRVLQARLQGKTIILTQQSTFGETMRRFWKKHHVKKALTDEELNQAARTSSIARTTKIS